MFKICGPKYSMCWTLISVWGIIQLSLMGAFYYTHAVALAEDLGLSEEFEDRGVDEYYEEVDKAYHSMAYKCWFAMAIYVATLLFSICQVCVNKQSNYQAA